MLDEPTNDLDLETLDLLQEVIADYEGTVLIVSHDRDFLDRTVTVTLGLDGSGRVDIVAGGYEDWAKRRRQSSAPAAKPKSAACERTIVDPRPLQSSATRTSETSTGFPARSNSSKRKSRPSRTCSPIPISTRAIRSALPNSATRRQTACRPPCGRGALAGGGRDGRRIGALGLSLSARLCDAGYTSRGTRCPNGSSLIAGIVLLSIPASAVAKDKSEPRLQALLACQSITVERTAAALATTRRCER